MEGEERGKTFQHSRQREYNTPALIEMVNVVRSEIGTHIRQLGNSLLHEFRSEGNRDLGNRSCQHH